MIDIPFPMSSNPGSAPGEGSGRVLNCYAYLDGKSPRWKPLPGLTPFATLPAGEVRGAILFKGFIVAVVGNAAVQIDASGNVTSLEEQVAGYGPVTIAQNNAVPPQITITSNNGAYVIEDGVVSPYPDINLPIVNSVAILDGFFLWTTPDGKIYASALNDTSVNALSFATAEARPDGLLRGVVYGQQFFAMGEETIEVWQDAGALPFPLARSTVIQIGLIAQWAVAGYEDGWAGPLIFVAQDGSVRSLADYTPTRISGDDLEKLIADVPVKSDLRAVVYTFGGNSIWSLSSTTWTWEYNITTGEWHERQSYLQPRWRGGRTVKAFDEWIVADQAGGSFYLLDAEARTEASSPLIWGMDAGPVKDFPSRLQVPVGYFDFVLGQAALGSSPQVELSWSHDGGAAFGNPIRRSLQRTGRSFGRIAVNRVGLSTHHGIRWRFRISDPAYSSFSGARMDVGDRK